MTYFRFKLYFRKLIILKPPRRIIEKSKKSAIKNGTAIKTSTAYILKEKKMFE